ncbi:hypothetical protein [Cognatiluteimonas weifangensis]|nr:hypothetical protein [Luteimonas weifangensis]
MRPVMYFVSAVADHWEVRCRAAPEGPDYPDRGAAVAAATQAARVLWEQQQVATEVLVDGGDGHWVKAAGFGELLSR